MPIESAPGDLASLVVDEGDSAAAEGVLLYVDERWCLVPDRARVLTEDGQAISATPRVDLRVADVGAVTSLSGHRLRAVGRWNDRQLSVVALHPDPLNTRMLDLDRQDPVSPRPFVQTAPTVTPRAQFEEFMRNPPPLPRQQQRSETERRLLAEGVLLGPVLRGGHGGYGRQPVAITSSTEGERTVRAALGDVYGNDLRVVVSPWGRQTLRQIRQIICQYENVIWEIGSGRGRQGLPVVTACVLHLPSALAQLLASFPRDAIALDVLVGPWR